MNNTDYQEMPCISSHWLKDMLDSPAHCYRRHLDPLRPVEKSTKALRFGTLIHCLTLTPLQFGDEFVLFDGERRSKADKARYAALEATGKTVIRSHEFDHAQAVVSALKANPEAQKLLKGGKKERTLIQPRAPGLLPLKARLDIHHEAHRLVVELKTTFDLQRFSESFERYRYPLSAAFYRDISRSTSVEFVVIQTREPYEIATFAMSREQLQEGREQYQSALRRFDECWKANHWPEAETMMDLDDDPLLMNFMPTNPNRQRFDLTVGELAL